VEEVMKLLADGPDIEERGGPAPTTTPLFEAAFRGHTDIVHLLLEHGGDLSATDAYGYKPLHRSALMGHTAVVVLLLEKGADISAIDNVGMTSLHRAARWGREEVVQLLLEHGADTSAKDNVGETAEDLATARSHIQIVAMLRGEARRREALRKAKCVAFAMGQHERLGSGSRARGLDPGVVRMVLEEV
jgi:ankyrin repeat protein